MAFRHPALAAFEPLPLSERLFVRARLLSAPLVELTKHVHGRRVLDVGCGHGLLVAMLALGFPEREVWGIDPDERKIDWARRSIGRFPNVRLEAQLLGALTAAPFDTICVADVLYLLPPSEWPAFLRACRARCVAGGRLVLKEAEDDGSWRVKKTLLQERVMVRVLGRTRQSGAVGFSPRAVLEGAVRESGFVMERVEALSRGYSTPHVLMVARAA